MANIFQIAEETIKTVASAFGVGTVSFDGTFWQWGPYTKEQIAEAKAVAKKAQVQEATKQQTERAINIMELVEKSKTITAEVLSGLTKNLDFELSTKSQPKDKNGKELDGKWEIVNIYRKTAKGSKSLLGYGVLYKITPEDKAIKTADEEPIENALRAFYKSSPVVSTPPPEAITPPAPLPPPQATPQTPPVPITPPTPSLKPYLRFGGDNSQVYERSSKRLLSFQEVSQGDLFNKQMIEDHGPADLQNFLNPNQPKFIRYVGSPNIFDRQTGKWISPSEAPGLGVFNTGAVQDISSPRPEVKIGSDFAIYNNRDLSVFPV